MSVFALTTLLLEIPTGVIADLLGKKKTLVLSRFMYIVEISIIAFFDGFWPFLVAKIISGIGVSLSSGTSSAFLFDTLKKLGRTSEHKKISGRFVFISSTSMAFVFVIGAYLFTFHPKLPAYASLPPIILGFILTFFLREPHSPHQSFTFSNSLLHLKEGLVHFKKEPYLQYLALIGLGAASAISIFLSMSSAYFERILIPLGIIGVISFGGNLLNAYSSKRAHSLEARLGEKKSLFISQTIIVAVFLLSATMMPYIGVIFYFLLTFAQGFYNVISGDYANRHARTSHRATTLSIVNMFDNIGIFLLFPVVGYLTKIYSMSFAFAVLSLFLSFYFLIIYAVYCAGSRAQ